jgi:hypothetical protein
VNNSGYVNNARSSNNGYGFTGTAANAPRSNRNAAPLPGDEPGMITSDADSQPHRAMRPEN